MPKKHFYSHIVETSSISLSLGDMDLTQEERVHLISLAEANMHQEIMHSLLSELSEDDKKVFLSHIAHDKHEEIWQLLKEKIQDAEEKIQGIGKKIINEVKKDIEEAKTIR